MECPFVEVGCSATHISTATDYKRHLSENTELHLQMVMDLHQRNLGYDSSSLKSVSLLSSLDKLHAVNQEIEYLDDVLQHYDMSQTPSLMCIKSVLALPNVWLRKIGDTCSFRMPGYSHKRSSNSKWSSSPFFVKGGHKMKITVHAAGLKSGANSHISVSLVLLFDDQLEWPISPPPHTGIRVELVHDKPDFEVDDRNTTEGSENKMEQELTWTTEDSAKEPVTKSLPSSVTPRRASNLPPWCSSPPHYIEHVSIDATVSSSSNPSIPTDSKTDEEESGDLILATSEKFAPLFVTDHYAEHYNSLVFQITLCLV